MTPVIAIPTTAGTGSEVGRVSVIIDERDHRKVLIFHPNMLPCRVLADPELTLALPPSLTAATGMDALVHNLEAHLSLGFHPIAKGISLQGMKLVQEWLKEAYIDGQNIRARSHMLAASILGATAFQNGLGAVHALAHSIGGLFNTHHGLTNAILLPYVLERNRSAIEQPLVEVARYMDLPKANYEGFMEWVLQLRSELNIPHTIRDIGINTQQAVLVSKMAKADASDACNPAKLTRIDYQQIFENAVAGKLAG